MKLTVQSQLSLLDLVKPPAGFELDFCLGTSYSLNLECLLQVGLTSKRISISKETVSPQEAFELVGDMSHRLLFFCNSCRIKEVAPSEVALMHPEYRKFWRLLDEAVKVVHPAKPQTCFHPKVTILRFKETEGDDVCFKLIVGSRNLTLDLSWDVAAAFVGTRGKRRAQNQGLRSFLERLAASSKTSLSKEQSKKIAGISEDLDSVVFSSPFGNRDFTFDFQWFDRSPFKFNLGEFKRLVAISPFVNISTLKSLSEKLDEFFLVTSTEGQATIGSSLPKNVSAFVFREEDIGLHSKMYVGQFKDGRSKVILGSANLTANGLATGNVEAVASLDVPNSFYADFVNSFIFQKQSGELALAPWLTEIDQAELSPDLNETQTRAEEIQGHLGSGRFELSYSVKTRRLNLRFIEAHPFSLGKGYSVNVKMLGSEREFRLQDLAEKGVTFECPISEVTRLLFIEIKFKDAKILSFMTIGEGKIPVRNRSRAVAKTVIQTWDDLLSYLGSVLGDDASGASTKQAQEDKRREMKKTIRTSTLPPAVLERVLMSCQGDDALIERIEIALSAVSENLQDTKQYEAFQRFWKELKSAIDRIKRAA